MIEHVSMKLDFTGNDIVLIGSKHSEKLQISIYSATFTGKARANDITVFGSGTAAPTSINIDYVTIRVDLEGRQAGLYRGLDPRVKVRVSNSNTEGTINTLLELPRYASEMDFKVTNSNTTLNINGHMLVERRDSEKEENIT